MPFASDDEILICSNHPTYQTPLIWTFAFPGSEWWCPYCGTSGGMLGTGESVPKTPALIARSEKYEAMAAEYLHAMAVRVCSGTEWPPGSGKHIPPAELPQEEKDRLEKVRESWRYRQRIENQ